MKLRFPALFFSLLVWLFTVMSAVSTSAFAALDPAVVKQLGAEESDDKIIAIQKLGQSGDPQALTILKAMADDSLYTDQGKVVILQDDKAFDAATGAEITPVPESPESIVVNNRLRGELDSAMASLKLFDPDRKVRLAAAQDLQASVDIALVPLLASAMSKETDPQIKKLLVLVHAQANLKNPDVAQRLAAVTALGDSGSATTKSLLQAMTDAANEPDEAVRIAASASMRAIDKRLVLGDAISKVFTGISLGSILMLAALGLAITYGVMGIINMAHGELLMVGAYSTYVMQSLFRKYLPDYIDWYVVAAIPVAFLVAAIVGIILERTVIRRLYGRTLETLLATWGLSLILIQAARVIFGPQNVELANPVWMSGGIELMSNVVLPLNRLIIVGFSMAVLLMMWLLMTRTRLGMFIRAVTQNRAMAGCVGVPTGRIDMLAFGLGAGVAGLGGVALSQISNVGPDMGQGYIVDSFMVVVLGGVGQLAGAAWAALGLGIITKFIEGWAGAVVAKIIVLVFVIIFIQKRPQGLFAIKGRFVES
jgi:urea transport system permease protein